jgi:hypothetical protein
VGLGRLTTLCRSSSVAARVSSSVAASACVLYSRCAHEKSPARFLGRRAGDGLGRIPGPRRLGWVRRVPTTIRGIRPGWADSSHQLARWTQHGCPSVAVMREVRANQTGMKSAARHHHHDYQFWGPTVNSIWARSSESAKNRSFRVPDARSGKTLRARGGGEFTMTDEYRMTNDAMPQ